MKIHSISLSTLCFALSVSILVPGGEGSIHITPKIVDQEENNQSLQIEKKLQQTRRKNKNKVKIQKAKGKTKTKKTKNKKTKKSKVPTISPIYLPSFQPSFSPNNESSCTCSSLSNCLSGFVACEWGIDSCTCDTKTICEGREGGNPREECSDPPRNFSPTMSPSLVESSLPSNAPSLVPSKSPSSRPTPTPSSAPGSASETCNCANLLTCYSGNVACEWGEGSCSCLTKSSCEDALNGNAVETCSDPPPQNFSPTISPSLVESSIPSNTSSLVPTKESPSSRPTPTPSSAPNSGCDSCNCANLLTCYSGNVACEYGAGSCDCITALSCGALQGTVCETCSDPPPQNF